jgi:two-component system phosphate regulon sensor histidine kinase PhoR
MSDQPLEGPTRSPAALAWAPLAVATAAVAMLVVLVFEGAAHLLPALLAGVLVLTLGAGAGLWLRRTARPTQTAEAPEVREREAPAAVAPPVAAVAVAPFAAILETLEDPVLVVAGEGPGELSGRRLLYANAAARDLFRTTREAAPLVTVVRDPKVLEAVDLALFEGANSETVYQSGGVQDRVWRAKAQPLSQGDARSLAVLILRDETEILRSERTRADFLANASHELRTPLASLAGFIETLRGHAREDPAARDRFLAIMQHQAGRMARLIDDLMSLSRIELNEHIPPQGRANLSLTLMDVLDALAPLAADKNVHFEVGPPDQQAVVAPADRDQVVQVIQNLAENALKYAPAESVVTLELSSGVTAEAAIAPVRSGAAHLSLLTPDHAGDQLYVLLRISDLGPGIAREHLPRLTERFYRVEGQRLGERPGTGLGLAIVKHIVNRHRGGMTVESTPGEGATFGVYFPMGK